MLFSLSPDSKLHARVDEKRDRERDGVDWGETIFCSYYPPNPNPSAASSSLSCRCLGYQEVDQSSDLCGPGQSVFDIVQQVGVQLLSFFSEIRDHTDG